MKAIRTVAPMAALLTLIVAGCASSDPDQILTENGYLPLRPASTFDGPGKIYAVELDAQSRPFLQEVCQLDQEKLLTYGGASSKTIETVFERKLTTDSSLSVAELQRLEIKLGLKGIRNVKYSIHSPSLLEIPDSGLEKIRRRLNAMDSGCLDAIRGRLLANPPFDVQQTQQVIKANLSYSVDFDIGVDADEKIQITKKLAPELTQTIGYTGSDSIVAENLYIGHRPYRAYRFTLELIEKLQKEQIADQ